MNKKIIFTLLNFFIVVSIYCQNTIDKAIINNMRFYIHKNIRNGANIKGYQLNKKHISYSYVQSSISTIYTIPFPWDFYDNDIFSVWIFGGKRYTPEFNLVRNPLMFTDSTTQDIKDDKKYEGLSVEAKRKQAITEMNKEANYNNQRSVFILDKLYEKIELPNRTLPIPKAGVFDINTSISQYISWDFIVKDTNLIEFYVRDFEKLTIWQYTYHASVHVKSTKSDWKEIKTYTNKKTENDCWKEVKLQQGKDFIKRTAYLPSYPNYIFDAFPDTLAYFMINHLKYFFLKKEGKIPDDLFWKIKRSLEQKNYTVDSIAQKEIKKAIGEEYFKQYKKLIYETAENLFFKGLFKAIQQDNETFIINQTYGAIYWLAPKAIYRVGQIDIENYNRKILNRQLFIEDRDNNQLIFFANVERLNQDKPFPKIKIITEDKEFNEMFKYVTDN